MTRAACGRTGAGWRPPSARTPAISSSPARCTAPGSASWPRPTGGAAPSRSTTPSAVPACGEADRAGAGADALVTASPGVVLAILTADCVPIVLHDPVAGVLACVHAGWRGTVAGVTAAALAAMQRLGARPSDVIAGIGPAIGADRYQVGPDVHEAVTRTFGPAAAGFIRPDPSAPGRWLLDLWAANRHALRQAGVPGPRIHTTDIPTGPVPGHFFSDRTARPCGRLALVARLRPGRCAMSTPRGKVFRYLDYAVDAERGVLSLPLRAGRPRVHRARHAAARRALAHRGGPRRRPAGVPAVRRLVLQDRRAPGHRPRRDRADRSRGSLPPRVLPPGPGRVRLPQQPRPHPAAPAGPAGPGPAPRPARAARRPAAPSSRSAAGSTRS